MGGFNSGFGAAVLAGAVTPLQGLVLEAVFTFFLVNTNLSTAVRGKGGNAAPAAIRMILTLCILMGGPLTGASLNPACGPGPAEANGNYADIWL